MSWDSFFEGFRWGDAVAVVALALATVDLAWRFASRPQHKLRITTGLTHSQTDGTVYVGVFVNNEGTFEEQVISVWFEAADGRSVPVFGDVGEARSVSPGAMAEFVLEHSAFYEVCRMRAFRPYGEPLNLTKACVRLGYRKTAHEVSVDPEICESAANATM